MTQKKKNIIIPFSSGVDSTALVHQALKNYQNYNIKLVYFRIQNNENKANREFEACKKIIAQFNILYPHQYINFTEQISAHVLGFSGISMFSQMPIWLMGLMYSCDYHTDEIWLGYCCNDDALSYIPDIKKIWASYKAISYTAKFPVLKFPLIKSKKYNHLNELPEEIRQLTTFCENPQLQQENTTFKDCGYCDSCKRYKYEDLFYSFNRNKPIDNDHISPALSIGDYLPTPQVEQISNEISNEISK